METIPWLKHPEKYGLPRTKEEAKKLGIIYQGMVEIEGYYTKVDGVVFFVCPEPPPPPKEEGSPLDTLQTVLDGVGLIPAAGELADFANGLISLGRGDIVGAGLSFVSVIPWIGDAIGKGGKVGRKVVKCGDKVTGFADEAAGFLRKKSDEFLDGAKKLADDAPRSRAHIGTSDSPGMPGGRINPGGLNDNCVACVSAVLHNKMVGNRTRTFFNAHDMARNFEAVGTHINPMPHEGAVISYLERNLGLTSTYARLPHVFDEVTSAGHYVLISENHIIYGRVLPNGKRFLYDPQIDEVINWNRAQEVLGASRPTIHQIVPMQ
jgi:hypothetical protein